MAEKEPRPPLGKWPESPDRDGGQPHQVCRARASGAVAPVLVQQLPGPLVPVQASERPPGAGHHLGACTKVPQLHLFVDGGILCVMSYPLLVHHLLVDIRRLPRFRFCECCSCEHGCVESETQLSLGGTWPDVRLLDHR